MQEHINISTVALKLASILRSDIVDTDHEGNEVTLSDEEKNKLLSFLHGYIDVTSYVKDDLYERLGRLARDSHSNDSLNLHARTDITPEKSYDLIRTICDDYYSYEYLRGIVIYAMGMNEIQFIALLNCLDKLDRKLLEEFYYVSEAPSYDLEDMDGYNEELKRSINIIRFMSILKKFFRDNTFEWSQRVIRSVNVFRQQREEMTQERTRSQSKKRTEDGNYYNYKEDGTVGMAYRDNIWQERDLNLEFVMNDMKRCKLDS